MSAITSARAVNPPLQYSKDAIRQHLQFHATNGPAYVQIQATKALARMIGLYDDAKQTTKQAVSQVVNETKSAANSLYAKIQAIRSGEYVVTEEDLNYFKVDDTLDDEEEGTPDDIEPP